MRTVELETPNGTARGSLFEPSAHNGAMESSVVVVHEWWGLNDSIAALSQRLSLEGFAVLAVDLYGGVVTDDASVALKLAIEMKTLHATTIVESAARYLKQRTRSNGRVAVMGFCLGGAVTLAAACHCPSANAFVAYYGMPLAKYVDWSKTLGPIQGHYAQHDPLIDLNRVHAAADAVNAHGGSFELHAYDAQHAFMRVEDPKVYSADAAALAWQRSLQFLRLHLS